MSPIQPNPLSTPSTESAEWLTVKHLRSAELAACALQYGPRAGVEIEGLRNEMLSAASALNGWSALITEGLERLESVNTVEEAWAKLMSIHETSPELFEAVAVFVVGAALMHQENRNRVGYLGQVRWPLNPAEAVDDIIESGLLDPVIERGFPRDKGSRES